MILIDFDLLNITYNSEFTNECYIHSFDITWTITIFSHWLELFSLLRFLFDCCIKKQVSSTLVRWNNRVIIKNVTCAQPKKPKHTYNSFFFQFFFFRSLCSLVILPTKQFLYNSSFSSISFFFSLFFFFFSSFFPD